MDVKITAFALVLCVTIGVIYGQEASFSSSSSSSSSTNTIPGAPQINQAQLALLRKAMAQRK